MSKVDDKKKILKAAKEKKLITYKGTVIRLRADFSAEKPCRPEEMGRYIQSAERKDLYPIIL